jgi:hypothetical protein
MTVRLEIHLLTGVIASEWGIGHSLLYLFGRPVQSSTSHHGVKQVTLDEKYAADIAAVDSGNPEWAAIVAQITANYNVRVAYLGYVAAKRAEGVARLQQLQPGYYL